MAKVSGIVSFRGKIGDFVFYRQRQNTNPIMRRVSTSMSEQLKVGENFANVRLYGKEFAQCAKLAGAMWSHFPQRFKAILISQRNSMLTRELSRLIRSDMSNPIGKRGLTGISWQEPLRNYVNTFAKRDFRQYYQTDVEASFTNDARGLLWTIDFPARPIESPLTKVLPNLIGYDMYVWAVSCYLYYTNTDMRNPYQSGVSSQSVYFAERVGLTDEMSEFSIQEVLRIGNGDKTKHSVFCRVMFVPVCSVGNAEYQMINYASFYDYPVTDKR